LTKHRRATTRGPVTDIYFSDYFRVSPDTLEEYGAFDISLVGDLPLFVDPFLLFNSENPTYQALHAEIIRYMRFLKDVRQKRGEVQFSIGLQPRQASLDIFWLRDESLEKSDNLPDPDVLAQEIVEDLEAALEQFREIAVDLGSEEVKAEKS